MEIKINKDIMSYDEKLLLGLTLKELFLVGGGALISLLIYVLTVDTLGVSLAGWLSVINELAFVLMALLRVNGRPLYSFSFSFIEYLLNRRRLYNRNTNIFEQEG